VHRIYYKKSYQPRHVRYSAGRDGSADARVLIHGAAVPAHSPEGPPRGAADASSGVAGMGVGAEVKYIVKTEKHKSILTPVYLYTWLKSGNGTWSLKNYF